MSTVYRRNFSVYGYDIFQYFTEKALYTEPELSIFFERNASNKLPLGSSEIYLINHENPFSLPHHSWIGVSIPIKLTRQVN